METRSAQIAAPMEGSAARPTRAERRRAAFETNLAARLVEEIGPAEDPEARRALIAALGHAYRQERHLIDARTVLGLPRRRFYVVMQAGLRRGAAARAEGAPFAAAVLDRAVAAGMRVDAPDQVMRAIARAEISQRHPIDHRIIFRTKWFALYWFFIGGRDRRAAGPHQKVTAERRSPVRPGLGALALFGVIFTLAAIGLALIAMTLFSFVTILSDPLERETLFGLIFAFSKEGGG